MPSKVVVFREDITPTGIEHTRVMTEDSFDTPEDAKEATITRLKDRILTPGRYCIGEFKFCLVGREEIVVKEDNPAPVIELSPPVVSEVGSSLDLNDHKSW